MSPIAHLFWEHLFMDSLHMIPYVGSFAMVDNRNLLQFLQMCGFLCWALRILALGLGFHAEVPEVSQDGTHQNNTDVSHILNQLLQMKLPSCSLCEISPNFLHFLFLKVSIAGSSTVCVVSTI